MNIEQSNELLAKFIDYSRKVVSYEEKVWNSSNEYYWSWTEGELWVDKNDVPIDDESDQLKFHYDWNELMKVVDKIRSYPNHLELPKGSISLLTFAISRTGIFMEYFKRLDHGKADYEKSYHQYVEDNPDASDCESYIQTIYKACVDFVKFINE